MYRNTPTIDHWNHSPIHHGAMILRVEGDPAATLTGEYWTDRLTVGHVQFTARSKTLFFDFSTASAATYFPA
jgi:hypothetical protein